MHSIGKLRRLTVHLSDSAALAYLWALVSSCDFEELYHEHVTVLA